MPNCLDLRGALQFLDRDDATSANEIFNEAMTVPTHRMVQGIVQAVKRQPIGAHQRSTKASSKIFAGSMRSWSPPVVCFAPEAANRKSNNTMSPFHSDPDIARQSGHVRKSADCVEKLENRKPSKISQCSA